MFASHIYLNIYILTHMKLKAAAKSYLLEESWVETWIVSNVHMTIMNGMITWKDKG